MPNLAGLSPNRVRKSIADVEKGDAQFKPFLAKFERVRAKTTRRIKEHKPKKKTQSVHEEIVTILHYNWEYTSKHDQEPIDKRCWRMLRYLEKLELALHCDHHLPAIFRIDIDIQRMRSVMMELKASYLTYDFTKFRETLKNELHINIEEASAEFFQKHE